MALAGLLFGLSVDTRAFVVGLAPIFLWWIFRDSEPASGIARTLWFLGGFTIGMVPSLYLFAASPDLFLFNNLRFHGIRSNAGLIGSWRQKMHIARILLFGSEDNGFQFSIVWAGSLGAIVGLRMRSDAAPPGLPNRPCSGIHFHSSYTHICPIFLYVYALSYRSRRMRGRVNTSLRCGARGQSGSRLFAALPC